jgi:transcriptional regulator with XRE-family HTH domain
MDTFDVRALRKRMRLTQRNFAIFFGFALPTLRHWERGNRTPTGTALVLLHVIGENPAVVRQAVRKARAANPRVFARVPLPKSYRAPPGMRTWI